MTRSELKTKMHGLLNTRMYDNKEFYIDDVKYKVSKNKIYMRSEVFQQNFYIAIDCFTDKELIVLINIFERELF